MNTKKKHTASQLNSIMARLRRCANLNAQLCLEESNRTNDTLRSESLEALAIQRAVIAEQITEIAEQKFSLESSPSKSELPASDRPKMSLTDCNRELYRLATMMYRNCQDRSIRSFLRELKSQIVGLVPQDTLSYAWASTSR